MISKDKHALLAVEHVARQYIREVEHTIGGASKLTKSDESILMIRFNALVDEVLKAQKTLNDKPVEVTDDSDLVGRGYDLTSQP